MTVVQKRCSMLRYSTTPIGICLGKMKISTQCSASRVKEALRTNRRAWSYSNLLHSSDHPCWIL